MGQCTSKDIISEPISLSKSNDFQTYIKYNMKTTDKLFENNGNYSNVRVLDIYDGDTITIAIKIFEAGNQQLIKKIGVRLMGIDTPEMKTKNTELKKCAYKARDRLYNLITQLTDTELKRKEMCDKLSEKPYLVTIKICGTDMYGRILAEIYPYNQINTTSFSQILLDEKLAYAYDGKTKLKENEILEAVE